MIGISNCKWRCVIKRKVIFGLLFSLILILVLVIPSCVPKKSTTTPITPADTDRIIVLESKVSQLQSKVASIPEPPNYSSQIADLQTKLNNIESGVQTQLDSFQPDIPDVPKFALVTEIGRKYIEVSTYGAGDYPVVVTLYGTGLNIDEVVSTDDDVVDELLYGTYTLTSASGNTLSVSSGTFTSNVPLPIEPMPNSHQHEVTISGLTVSGASYTLTFNGTMLVVVVEPDKEWEASDTFELDIRDMSGEVYYATAVVSAGE